MNRHQMSPANHFRGWREQTVDKTTGFRQFEEKFWSSFFKSSRSGGRGAILALRRGRNSLFMALFFLPSFFFCAFLVKRKSGTNKFVQYYKLNTFGLQPAPANHRSGWRELVASYKVKNESVRP
ncbi:MAG: hypothetical protein IJW92_05920 [Clostridia bacterium]|nr:hypothetical protein [Clostridia bacterium]